MSDIVLDIETDSLYAPTKLWCVSFCPVDDPDSVISIKIPTGKPTQYQIDTLQAIVDEANTVIGHNFIYYDHKWIEALTGVTIPREKVMDTLVLSRLLWVDRPGGHSLDAWGQRLKFPKQPFTDFDSYSDAMVSYCENDVKLNAMVYNSLMGKLGTWSDAIGIEMFMQWQCRDMTTNGFYFDIDEAKKMHLEMVQRSEELRHLMSTEFKPVVKVTELKTKTKVETIPFNPGSPKQVIDRLWEAGWQPYDKTKGHIQLQRKLKFERRAPTQEEKQKLDKFSRYGWKVNEANLQTLPDNAPDAYRYLVEWLLVDARRSTLEEWMNAYNPDTHRIHGLFSPLGTKTQRCVHNKPNMGNVPTAKTIKYNNERLRELAITYGGRMRSMWQAPPGKYLVGVDMESAHLRIFGHLINDKPFIEALINGTKENGTDPHSLNKQKLGTVCPDRDRAKTFKVTWKSINPLNSGNLLQ